MEEAAVLTPPAVATAGSMVAFQGGDEWIRRQYAHHAAKARQRAQRAKATTPAVIFDRDAFTTDVKSILDLDVNAGFVIGLKRRREFAAKLCEDYKLFTEPQKLALVLALAVDLGLQDLSLMVKSLPSLPRTHLVLNVLAASLGFARKNEPNISKSIKRGLVPVPEQFFLLVGSVSRGPKFLLTLRVDLNILLRKYRDALPKSEVEALEYLDMVMRDLFATQAGMRFRRIDMGSEKLVSFVVRHERVHAVRGWSDIVRRITGPNRYCFGLFHLHMPYAPIVFVQVLVSDHLCDKIDPILNADGPVITNPSHIVFYSISNANQGLRELNTASHLLFLTIERMSSLFPMCHTSATLSPVPGFADWFKLALDRPTTARLFFSDEQVQHLSQKFKVNQNFLHKWLSKRLDAPDWHLDDVFAREMKEILVTACARYVLFERRGEKMLNPVANFHLQNGAQVEQIDYLADPSPGGMKNAFGMMINYRYCMDSINATSVSYKRTSAAAVSPAVSRIVWPSSSLILDELEKLQYLRSIPLYARTYQRGEIICKRGSLPTAVYFICTGRIRVGSAHPYALMPGAVYGHNEILNGEPVPFTLRAEATTNVIQLSKDDMTFLSAESSSMRTYAALDVRERLQLDKKRRGEWTTSRL